MIFYLRFASFLLTVCSSLIDLEFSRQKRMGKRLMLWLYLKLSLAVEKWLHDSRMDWMCADILAERSL